MFSEYCQRLSLGKDLSQCEMEAAVHELMSGGVEAESIARFLLDLNAKGETVDELAGAAQAMRRHMVPITCRHSRLVDTCGTGGVGSELFNVSTTAALVTAAAGLTLESSRRVAVAKHGNRSVTSKSGSADVLAALGVDIDAPVPTVERCLDELGIGFCFAPRLHPAMRHVAPIRRQLGVRTIFNLLGPLCNPASAAYQLLGVGRAEFGPILAATLQRLGTRRAVVVSGTDGVGEVTLAGDTEVRLVHPDEIRVDCWQPGHFGRERASLDTLRVEGPAESAAMIHRVLAGERDVPRDMVVINAAAALWTAEVAAELRECADLAQAALDSGAARILLNRWVELSQTR